MNDMRSQAARQTRSTHPEVLVVDGLVLHVTMTDGQIERFARERRSWILAQQQRIREARQRLADGTGAEPGATHGGEPAGFIHDAASWWTPERRNRAASAIDARLPALVEHWSAVIGKRPTHIDAYHIACDDDPLGILHAADRSHPVESATGAVAASVSRIRARP